MKKLRKALLMEKDHVFNLLIRNMVLPHHFRKGNSLCYQQFMKKAAISQPKEKQKIVKTHYN